MFGFFFFGPVIPPAEHTSPLHTCGQCEANTKLAKFVILHFYTNSASLFLFLFLAEIRGMEKVSEREGERERQRQREQKHCFP